MRRLGRHYIPARYRDPVTAIAAAVIGSVARGDFNVWSDVDVVVAEEVPERMPDRAALLTADAPGRVQPVGFRPDEFDAARRKGNRLAREASEAGVVMAGGDFFRQRSRSAP
jgi:predicted nucleotidyltransferase